MDQTTTDFSFMWDDFDQARDYPSLKPRLAHYSSAQTIAKILASREIWLSSPLLMNDFEELRFGLGRAKDAFVVHQGIRDACRPDQHLELVQNFEGIFDDFSDRGALDVFIFCLSEFDDPDGRLSMWRGYGGNGSGAALVFDLAKVKNVPQSSPLVLAKVHYASTEERMAWINGRLDRFAKELKAKNPTVPEIRQWAWILFLRLLQGALFTKHRGFREEQEWRLAYYPKWTAVAPSVNIRRDFLMTKRGVEPKLVIGPNAMGEPEHGGSGFDELLELIVLGPGMSGGFEYRAFSAMLRQMRAGLAEKVRTSSTPYRPIE